MNNDVELVWTFLGNVTTINQAKIDNIHRYLWVKNLGQDHPAGFLDGFFCSWLLRNIFFLLNHLFANGIRINTLDAVHIALYNDGKTTTELRSEEHTSELQSRGHLVCRLLLEKKTR